MKIFVFGSNTQGRHGAGAALWAKLNRGAVYGQAEGLQGRSYAIVTKELRPNYPPVTLEDVVEGVDKFLEFARANPELEFYVTPIGCGLAGFRDDQVAPLFRGASENVELPYQFRLVLIKEVE